MSYLKKNLRKTDIKKIWICGKPIMNERLLSIIESDIPELTKKVQVL